MARWRVSNVQAPTPNDRFPPKATDTETRFSDPRAPVSRDGITPRPNLGQSRLSGDPRTRQCPEQFTGPRLSLLDRTSAPGRAERGPPVVQNILRSLVANSSASAGEAPPDGHVARRVGRGNARRQHFLPVRFARPDRRNGSRGLSGRMADSKQCYQMQS